MTNDLTPILKALYEIHNRLNDIVITLQTVSCIEQVSSEKKSEYLVELLRQSITQKDKYARIVSD